jgi:hypothetical protein
MQCNYLKYNYLIFRTPLNYYRHITISYNLYNLIWTLLFTIIK